MSLKMVEAVRDCLQVLRFVSELSEGNWLSMAERAAIEDLTTETLDEILAPRLKRIAASSIAASPKSEMP